jgi:hypothetical protein
VNGGIRETENTSESSAGHIKIEKLLSDIPNPVCYQILTIVSPKCLSYNSFLLSQTFIHWAEFQLQYFLFLIEILKL